MQFDPIIPAARAAAMKAAGHWRDRVLLEFFDAAIARRGDVLALVDHNSMTGARNALSYAELGRRVERIALGLLDLGVEAGDVVSYQLPNWWEFTALHLACLRIGAVSNPLMPIFRQRELSFMLGLAEAKVLVVPKFFRGFDYPAMAAELHGVLPALRHVLVVGGSGEQSFEERLLELPRERRRDAAASFAVRRAGPDDVMQVMYTSGTTGEPKGVMHTANTLFSNIVPYAERLGLGERDVVLMASPMAHQTGFMYGLMLPIYLGAKAVLQDIWQADRGAEIIAAEGATFTMASTPFLADMAEAATRRPQDFASLRMFLAAGAPIPRVLVQKASEALGANIISAWGMTENGAVTTTRVGDAPDKTFGTDGCPVPGMEVRTIDAAGRPVAVGEEGRLQTRGCSNFVGYLKRPQLYGTDAEGWFETGDLARIDADGYIRITGRAKDIIIRGGENIPVVEVEGLIYRHPAVQEAAIVGMPDPRLGERGCAFIVLRPGQSLSFQELIAFLRDQKLARDYLPERLEIVAEMPKTPSGKIQKFKLREAAKAFGAA
ncbi:MAG TPA: cyclohexanecarboxylate-CoA ligase [Candidatus Sulfotelmatobacter sp.]|nr:cyclohexanecarboxylate-CoA ligase [Candidatus Sulfotelmatobacter sp.]